MNNKRKSGKSPVKEAKKKPKETLNEEAKPVDSTIKMYWCEEQKVNFPYLGSDIDDYDEEEDTCCDLMSDFRSVTSKESVIQEEEVERSSVRYYFGKNAKVIVLKKGSVVYITGTVQIRVLYGGVEAFGYEFHPGDTVYELYSLRGWSQIYLKHTFGNVTNCKIMEILKKYEFNQTDIQEIRGGLDLDMAVILFLPSVRLFMKYIERCIAQVILPPATENFQAYFSEEPSEQVLKIDDRWYNIVNYHKEDIKVMLCGGKGVGKSTLLRFMINRLLVFHKKICVIDLDPGQSEFTMSGCISVVFVDKPVLGPNFTHQTDAARSILQNIDASYAPLNYIEAVEELYKFCSTLEKIPTLINTMGFTKGLGLEVMSSTIGIVDPKTVIEIKSYKPQKDFSRPLTKETVYSNYSTFLPDRVITLNYDFIPLSAPFDEDITGFRPAGFECRNFSTIAYFGNILDRNLSLKSGAIPMYKINLNQMTVLTYCEYRPVKESNKADIINANIVALCSKSDKSQVYVCYGYGIVRSIIDNKIYLITPVKDSIQQVTHLIIGIVQMPSSMLDDGTASDGPIPYFSRECMSEFSYVPRRSYLPRKSH